MQFGVNARKIKTLLCFFHPFLTWAKFADKRTLRWKLRVKSRLNIVASDLGYFFSPFFSSGSSYNFSVTRTLSWRIFEAKCFIKMRRGKIEDLVTHDLGLYSPPILLSSYTSRPKDKATADHRSQTFHARIFGKDWRGEGGGRRDWRWSHLTWVTPPPPPPTS